MAKTPPETTSMGVLGGNGRKRPQDQSVPELIRSIASDTSTLLRKEIELARQEVVEGVMARVKAAAALAVGAIVMLFVLVFLGTAAAAALDKVMAPWASRLVVAGGFTVIAAVAALVGLRGLKSASSLKPERTRQTVKEDVEWAKAQLKR